MSKYNIVGGAAIFKNGEIIGIKEIFADLTLLTQIKEALNDYSQEEESRYLIKRIQNILDK